jgi:TPR repeat protein
MGMVSLMGQLGMPVDHGKAMQLLRAAADNSSMDMPQPAYVYGLLLFGEFPSATVSPQLISSLLPPATSSMTEARRHIDRAAFLGFAPAQYKLGHCYEYATPPFPFDPLLSVQYYSLASQHGEVEADMALSKWFLCGAEGAFDKDENLAYTFAEKAAKKGLATAQFAMGYYAEVGVGRAKDLEVARKWYLKVVSSSGSVEFDLT